VRIQQEEGLWALGYLINNSKNNELIEKAKVMFDKSHSLINENSSPRAKAFSVIGLYHYYKNIIRKRYFQR